MLFTGTFIRGNFLNQIVIEIAFHSLQEISQYGFLRSRKNKAFQNQRKGPKLIKGDRF
jgi:hypothetical protein